DPQTSPESRGGGELVKTQLHQPGGRTVQINYLVRGGRVIDVYLNGTVSDLATRRDEFASILAGGGGAGRERPDRQRIEARGGDPGRCRPFRDLRRWSDSAVATGRAH